MSAAEPHRGDRLAVLLGTSSPPLLLLLAGVYASGAAAFAIRDAWTRGGNSAG